MAEPHHRSVRPLHDVYVVDATSDIAGPYCTKLFVDAGAQVVKVESPGGDRLRTFAATVDIAPGTDGPLFRFLNAGKQSIVADPSGDRVDALLSGADLFVHDGRVGPADLDLDAVAARHPHLVVVSITPYGRTGPDAGRPATDLTLQAASGAMKFKGARGGIPVAAGGRVTEFFGGLFAAPGALAAILRARSSGAGELIDVSLHDTAAVAGSNYSQVLYDLIGRPPAGPWFRFLDTPGIEHARDGMVAFNTNAGPMLQMFLLLVERPDLMDDHTYASIANRLSMGDEWQRIIDDWVGPRTVAEVIDAAVALRIPVAPVHDGATVLDDAHLRTRGVFVEESDGFVHPRPPYLIDGRPLSTGGAAPLVGEHDAVVVPRPRPATLGTGHERDGALPLAGLVVIDLTSWWVGGLATQTLALLGADVVHIEGVAHPDGMRLTGSTYARTEDWWEWGHMFSAANAGKRGITLDLATSEGRALLHDLIDRADMLVENFSPRVADSWGLTADEVLTRHPNLVYLRMPAYGLDGPWRDRPAFAQTIEPMSTMASITGFPDAKPVSKGGVPDPIAGAHGAWAALIGLVVQRERGSGVVCESVMIEAALNVCAQPALEHAAFGETMARCGNRAAHAAPQGVYPCEGEDEWVAVSVVDDDQWRALAVVIGGAALAADGRYSSAASRHRHHDELDSLLAAWSTPRPAEAAADQLATAGVPAAACRDPRIIAGLSHYDHRRLFEWVDHPVLGAHRVPGLPYRYRGVDRWVRFSAPTFGQHTAEVLREKLGLDPDEIARLAEAGITSTRPRGL